jgi:peroxiredoxin (alkyl hydroperoxide reductase subunit C)
MSVLVGKQAPAFNTKAVVNGSEIVENFSLKQYEGEKYVVFFFYPADFTFVCPTELIAFQDKIQEFESRNVAVVGASTDSEFSALEMASDSTKSGWYSGCEIPNCRTKLFRFQSI